jgi:hypothetical protein
MLIVAIIDLLAVAILWRVAVHRGFEQVLPIAAFLLVLVPNESQIKLPGLFDLTTQRLIVVVLLVLYLAIGRVHKPAGESSLPLRYLLVLQLVWLLLSAANSVVFTISIKTVLSQLLDFYVVYYIFAKSITRVGTVNKVLYGFVLSVLVCSILGAVEAYSGWSVLAWFPPTVGRFDGIGALTDRGIRARATFAHPILYGGALAMAIPMALYLLTGAKTAARKVLLWSAVMLMFLNIYKTGSRGPWIALMSSLAILALLSRSKVRKYLVSIALLIVTVLVARPGVWESISNLYLLTLNSNSAQGESYEYRYDLYRTAWQELSRDPGRALWGYGPESFYYLGLKGQFEGHLVPYESCDSSVVALLIETGYVGFLIAAAFLLMAAWRAFQSFLQMPPRYRPLCLMLFVNMTAFYFLMTNVAIFGWGQQSYMLWVIMGIAVILPRLVKAETVAHPGKDRLLSSVRTAASEPTTVNAAAPAMSGFGNRLLI